MALKRQEYRKQKLLDTRTAYYSKPDKKIQEIEAFLDNRCVRTLASVSVVGRVALEHLVNLYH